MVALYFSRSRRATISLIGAIESAGAVACALAPLASASATTELRRIRMSSVGLRVEGRGSRAGLSEERERFLLLSTQPFPRPSTLDPHPSSGLYRLRVPLRVLYVHIEPGKPTGPLVEVRLVSAYAVILIGIHVQRRRFPQALQRVKHADGTDR